MNQTQIPSSGLMQQDAKLSSLREQIRSSLGPSKEPRTLDEQLKRLSKQELNHLLSMARMVKIAHGFGSNRSRSYVDLIREMYPQFSSSKRSLIGAILQDADPVENTALTPVKSLLDYTNAALDEWTQVLAAPEPTPVPSLAKQAAKPNKATPAGAYGDKAAFIAQSRQPQKLQQLSSTLIPKLSSLNQHSKQVGANPLRATPTLVSKHMAQIRLYRLTRTKKMQQVSCSSKKTAFVLMKI